MVWLGRSFQPLHAAAFIYKFFCLPVHAQAAIIQLQETEQVWKVHGVTQNLMLYG
jgi:hypothetical protein